MTIQARLADGRTLEFPDDTPPEVVDEAVKRLLGEGAPRAPFSLKDTGLALGTGAIGSTKALVDMFGADSDASRSLGDASEYLGKQFTPARQKEKRRRQALQQQAEQTGSTMEEVKSAAAGVAEAPIQSLFEGIGSIAPHIATGVGGKVLQAGTAATRATMAALGAAQGAGSVKGSIYDAVYNRAKKEGMSEEEARALAAEKQAYAGGNLDNILLGTGVGGVAGVTGTERLLLPGAQKTAAAGMAKRVGTAIAADVPVEAGQGGQERFAGNVAQQRAGYDTPTWQGVGGQATQEGLMAGLSAGAVGAVRSPHKTLEEEASKEKAAAAAAAAKVKAEALAAETARQQTPEYAAEVEKTYLALEQKRKDLIASRKPTDKNSPTFAADKLANKEISDEIARMTKEELNPAAEAYQKVRGVLVQNPAAAPGATAPTNSPRPAETDLFGDPVAPAAETPATEDTATRLGELQQQIRMLGGMEEGLKDKRTTIRGLVQERQDALAQAKNPDEVLALGAQHVESQKALDAALKEFHELYAKSNAPTESATLASKYNRTMAAMQKAQEEGDTEQAMKHAAKAKELNQGGAADMALATIAQAKSAGTQAVVTNKWRTPTGSESTDAFNQRVVGPEMAAGREAAAAARQKVEAEIAAIQGLADKEPTTPYANEVRQEKGTQREISAMEARRMETGRTDQLSLLDKAPPLQSRVVRGISLGGEGPTGELTAGLASKQPRQVGAKQDASISMGQSLAQLLQATPEDVEAAQGRVLERMATDIETTTGKPLPQSARYALAAEARPVLETLSQSAKRMTDARKAQSALDAIRNRLVTTDPGAAVDTAYTPDTTAEEALNDQIDRAIAARGIDPEQRALLERVVDNLPAVQANPERRNMVADWLHQDLGVAQRTGTERQSDVAQALDTLEGGKRSETEQVGGETRTAVQPDMFPQEQYQGKMFATPEAFDAYLGGEALHRMRLLMGKTVQTLSRATRLVTPLRRRAEELRKNVTRLQQTWAEQEAIGADNMDAATQAHEAAKARLQAAIDNVNDALRPLTDDLNRAQAEFDATTANSKEISAMIATNTAKFKGPALVAATEAWSSAVADFEQASRAVTTPGSESVTIDAALKAHAKVLSAAKKQNALLQKDVGEKAMMAFMQKDLNYQMQLADELGHVYDAVHNLTAAQMELDMAQEDLMRQPGVKSDLSARKGFVTRTANAREALRKSNDAKLRETSRAIYTNDDKARALEQEIDAVLAPVMQAQADRAAPPRGETQADREDQDAAARKAENERMESLADLPGIRVTHEAYRKALERLESAPARVAELQTKAADTTLPKTTRDKARRQELQLEREVQLASGMLSHSGEDMAKARQQATDALVALRDKVEAKREAAAEDGIAKSTADSRRRELGKLQRQAASLARLVNSLNNQAEVTPLETSDTRRATAKDRAAELYLERAVNLETLGTTGKLPPRKIGPLVKNQVTAGNMRTGDLDTVDERNLPSTNKVKQAGKVRGITGTQAVRAAAKDTAHEQAMLEMSKIEDLQERNSDALALAQEAGDEALIAKYESFATRLEAGHAKASKLVQRGNVAAAKAAEFEGEWEASDSAGYGVAAANFTPHIVRSRSESKPESKPVSASDLADGTDAREAHLRSIAPGIEFDTASPLHGKTYAEAARSAAKNPSSPAIGAILNKLADLLERAPNTDMTGRVYVMSKPGKLTKAGARKMGAAEGSSLNPHFDADKDYALVISDGLATAANRLDDVNLAHELAHVATVRGLLLGTPESEALRKELDVLLSTIKAWVGTKKGKAWLTENWRTEAFAGNFGKDGLTASAEAWHKVIYGLTDTMELLAEGLSNRDFQKLLAQIRTGPGKPNLLSRFFTAVTDYLGFTVPAHRTALHELLSLADRVTAETERTFAQPALWRDTAKKHGPVVGWQTVQYAPNSALDQAAKAIISQPKTWKERLGRNLGLEAEMNLVDMRAGVREMLKRGAAAFGTDKEYVQAMSSLTKADQRMTLVSTALSNGFLETYTDDKGLHGVRSSGKASAKDVFAAVSDMPGNDVRTKMAQASTYLIAQRAANVGFNKLNMGELDVTEEQLNAAMAEVNADPELKKSLEKVRKTYNAYNAGMIKFLADTGAIPKQRAAALLKNEDYVPYYRVDDNGMASLVFDEGPPINIGDVRHQPYLQELKGGQTKIMPLNESLPRNTMLLIDKAMTNMAAKNIAYAAQTYGAGKISRGMSPAAPDVIRFNQEPDPNDSKDTGERWIRIKTEGTSMEGIPAALVVKSLEGVHLTLPAFVKWGAVAGDLLRSGVTRSPLYVMRQLFRDPMIASFTGGLNYGPLRAIFKAGNEFVQQTRGTSEAGAELIRKGLTQSQIFNGDADDLAKMSLQLASGKDLGVVDRLFAMADRAAMRADAATRALVYENAIANSLSEVEADLATMESMNFHKRGMSPSIQYASRMIPFFNAQIQGLNVLYKAARGQMPFEQQQQIKRKFQNNAKMLMLGGAAYAMLMWDDEEYRNAKPRDRYTNFFVPIPGMDERLKLPIPYEAGWFFSAAVALVDAMRDDVQSPEQFKAFREMFIGAIPGASSMFTPALVGGAAQVWANKSFLSGQEIESQAMRRLDPSERFHASTTEAAKAMSNASGNVLSAVQIEFLLRNHLGTIPLMAMAAANGLFPDNEKGEKPAGRITDVPMLSTAFQRKFGGANTEAAYAKSNETEQAANTLRHLQKEGRFEAAKEFREEHKVELRIAPVMRGFEASMKAFKEQENNIRANKTASAEAKQARLDFINQQRQKLAERTRATVRRLEDAAV